MPPLGLARCLESGRQVGEPGWPEDDARVDERDAESDTVHWLDLGSDLDPNSGRRRPRRWRWWGALAVAMVAALLLIRTQDGAQLLTGADRPSAGAAIVAPAISHSASPAGPSPASPSGSTGPLGAPQPGAATADSTAGPATVDASTVAVTELGRPLLAVPADWELFGQGPGVVVRMELAAGRITRTKVPLLGSASPIFFVVGQDRAIVHPMDWVPGYVVHDGKPATRPPPALNQAVAMLPGPDQRHLWAETRAGTGSALTLLTLDGRPAGVQIPIPQDATVQASDRAGNVLMFGIGGMYDARPDGMHRITSGTLLAVGPTHWLARECDERYHCAGVVIDRASGTRRALRTPLDSYEQTAGAVSPDGRMAALLQPNGVGGSNVHLIDLANDADRVTGVTTNSNQTLGGRAFVWSPDSRWLFVTNGAGQVRALNRAGWSVTLDVRVGRIEQLALRAASR